MTELKWEHETSHTAVPIRYITDDQHHQHHHHSGGHVPIHSDDQVTVLAPNVVTAYDDHQQVYTQVHDDTKQATYQLWKLEPPQQPQEIIVHTTSQSTGQSGSTVIEDIGAHENDFDMMLYDEPSQQDTQNGNDVVLTEKVVVNGWQEGKWYYCGTCGMRFRTERGLFDHDSATHQGIKPYKCSKCGMGFKDQWKLKTHQIVHTDHKPFTCSICSKGFRTKFNLQRHEKTHRKKGSIKTESKNASPTSSSCSVTASLSPINQRINEERPVVDIAAIENSVVVDDHEVIKIERDDHSECSVDSSSSSRLPSDQPHSHHHHHHHHPHNYRYKPMRPRSPGELTCKICGKMFKTVSYLKEHQIVHSNEQERVCYSYKRQ